MLRKYYARQPAARNTPAKHTKAVVIILLTQLRVVANNTHHGCPSSNACVIKPNSRPAARLV